MAMMTVYHGGERPVVKPKISDRGIAKDFGNGFYTTLVREQAERRARRYNTSVVSVYDVRLNTDLKIREFKGITEEWLDFIIACRSGKRHSYDIVIGMMADEQIYNLVSDYIDGVIRKEQFWILTRFKYPTYQIAFCTEKALKCLEYRD